MLIGTSPFEARLIQSGDTDADGVAAARQRARQDHSELVDAVVALGLLAERSAYSRLADAVGMAFMSLDQIATSEFARRLVSERLARRHGAVPLSVDNRGLAYVTHRPFNTEADRDLSFASGRQAQGVLATRSDVLAALDRLYPPLRELDRVLAASEESLPSAASHRRVLIADDEPVTRMLLRLLLEREHYDVLEAANGQEALDIATRSRPDVLLIDLSMPAVDGYEAIKNLRRDISLAGMPIVVLTADHGPGVEGRVLDLGADDYVQKPFDPGVLTSRVQAAFRRMDAKAA